MLTRNLDRIPTRNITGYVKLHITGEIIHGFAFSLIIGVIIGSYSSIYIASSTLLAMGISKQDLMPAEKDGGVIDNRP